MFLDSGNLAGRLFPAVLSPLDTNASRGQSTLGMRAMDQLLQMKRKTSTLTPRKT